MTITVQKEKGNVIRLTGMTRTIVVHRDDLIVAMMKLDDFVQELTRGPLDITFPTIHKDKD